IIVMIVNKIQGGDATALLGGTGIGILLAATIAKEKGKSLSKVIDHLKEGFKLSIGIFAPVIPIAGFFFLGGSESVMILGENAPKFLFDIGEMIAGALPLKDRKSTRLNSSHVSISYAVFCLKKK